MTKYKYFVSYFGTDAVNGKHFSTVTVDTLKPIDDEEMLHKITAYIQGHKNLNKPPAIICYQLMSKVADE